MTEDEWLVCTNPQPMLEFLRGKTSDRKLRLFACACCRRVWHLLIDERSRQAVEIGERYADGEVNDQERERAYRLAREGYVPIASAAGWYRPTHGSVADLRFVVDERAADAVLPACAVFSTVEPNDDEGEISGVALVACGSRANGPTAEDVAHRLLLADIFGNPFRPLTLASAWRTSNVTALAQAAYNERTLPEGTLDPARLAVLADALEDAGCDNEGILAHLRSDGPHARGCWPLDLMLGKE